MEKRASDYIAGELQKLTAGRITRRRFMANATAAGLAVGTALTMSAEALAAVPKKGGSFKAGLGSGATTDSLDPQTYEATMNGLIGSSWGNTILEIDAAGNVIPVLVSSFESKDANTWVLNLRKGVEFHNGKTMDADDVIASINHHRGADSKSAINSQTNAITSMKADGKDKVIVELKGADADFPVLLTDYHLVVMPAKDGKVIDPQSGIGTGGYIVQSYEPGVRFRGKRNPNYFRSDRAYFNEVELLSIIDPTARQTALLNGSVNAIDRLDPKTLNLLAQAPNIKVSEVTGYQHYTMPMHTNTAPFDNYDLRMALKFAVKRQELVDKILLGHGALGNDHPIASSIRYHNGKLPQREFDADKAKFHYKKSGHSGTLDLSASDAAFAGAVDAAQLVAASAKECGISINVVREPSDGYWSNVWNKKPWCMCYWGGRPTVGVMFDAAYVRDVEWNDTKWTSGDAVDRFNDLVVKGRSELNDKKRAAIYAEAQALVNDQGGALIPMFANYIDGLHKDIGHGEMAVNQVFDGMRAVERWWIS